MSETGNFPIDQFLVERPDPDALPDTLLCMDDRPLAEARAPYWQIGGGIDGVGRDIGVALEAERPGRVSQASRPLHLQGLLAARALKGWGVEGLMHKKCAAYGLAPEVTISIVEEPDEVFARSLQINPELTLESFERIQAANHRLLEGGVVLPAEETDNDLLNGQPRLELPGVPRLPLVDELHQARDILVDFRRDALLDVRGAFNSGSPIYCIGLGIYRHVALTTGVGGASAQMIDDATVVRHAAISLKLPMPGDQEAPRIHLREAA